MKSAKIKFLFWVLISFSIRISAQTTTHQVLRGETFSSISSKYGISEETLKKANPRATVCYAGLKLVIPEITKSSNITYTTGQKAGSTNKVIASNSTTGQKVNPQSTTNQKVKKKNNFWKGALSALGTVAMATAEVAVAVAESNQAGPGRTDINIDGIGVQVKHTSVEQQRQAAIQQQMAYQSNPALHYNNGNTVSSNPYNQAGNITETGCYFCKGRKVCGICNGTGGTRNSVRFYPCRACNATGICQKCNERGTVVTLRQYNSDGSLTAYSDNGTVSHTVAGVGTTITDRTGRTNYYASGGNNYEESDSQSTKHGVSTITCTKCNGAKYESRASTVEPTGKYYLTVSANETCRVPGCNAIGKHWHWPCSHCQSKGTETKRY